MHLSDLQGYQCYSKNTETLRITNLGFCKRKMIVFCTQSKSWKYRSSSSGASSAEGASAAEGLTGATATASVTVAVPSPRTAPAATAALTAGATGKASATLAMPPRSTTPLVIPG
eukprot:m.353338 g.353338  ORF g.353338 m.353338 type:complete len:115 (-) comp16592_c0_seq12:1265-1609(-)